MRAVGSRLAESLRAEARSYEELFGKGPEEALAMARDEAPGAADDARRTPPENVSWSNIRALFQTDATLAAEKWLELREAARADTEAGIDAGEAVGGAASGPWDLARFLARRERMMAGWQPQNGIEQSLIDVAVQTETILVACYGELNASLTVANLSSRRDSRTEQLRLDDAQAIDRALKQLERLHGLWLRTVRALQVTRQASSRVVVRGARQINVADKQVNLVTGG
jgi:hypothetical protein